MTAPATENRAVEAAVPPATADQRALIKARHIALGRFLRERRARLQPPGDASAAPARRRVTGLRRDEVAALAGIGVSWYTMLEQGHVENVSLRALVAIARALRLTQPERDHLVALAANSFAELDIDRTPPPPELIAFILNTAVGMAFIVSPTFDVVAYNAQAAAFFNFDAHGARPNLLRIMLGDRAMRARFIDPDWPAVLASMIGHFRIWSGRVGGLEFAALVEELVRYPEFNAIWSACTIAAPPSERTLLAVPGAGQVLMHIAALSCFTCPTYTIIIKTPIPADHLAGQDQQLDPPAFRAAPGSADERRRAEVGAFLRQRRERTLPQQIGISPLGRRHARGLRRDEVAARAGIGLSWYTMLEQGRVENVSQRTLRAVAAALNLTPRERMYLERLSLQSFAQGDIGERTPSPELLRLVASFPDVHAHFHDAHFNMLAWNAPAEEFYRFGSPEWVRPNLLEIMVRNLELRTQFAGPDWIATLERMLAHYRFTHALFGDCASDAMIDKLVHESAEFAAVWRGEIKVVNPATEIGRLVYPRSGTRVVHVILLAPANLPAHTLVLKVAAEPAALPRAASDLLHSAPSLPT